MNLDGTGNLPKIFKLIFYFFRITATVEMREVDEADDGKTRSHYPTGTKSNLVSQALEILTSTGIDPGNRNRPILLPQPIASSSSYEVANMSRARFLTTQCTGVCALFVILIVCLTLIFTRLEEANAYLIHFLMENILKISVPKDNIGKNDSSHE